MEAIMANRILIALVIAIPVLNVFAAIASLATLAVD
jgi:hypothetical protein